MATLYASFADAELAERAAGALLDHGVRTQDVSLVVNADYNVTERRLDPGNEAYDREAAAKTGITTTTAADAGAGAVKGAEVGLGLGVIAGLVSLLVPGIGLVLGGGALAMAAAAAAATTAAGAVAGGVVGYLTDQGVPEDVATSYDQAVRHGGAMLAVHAPSGEIDVASIQSVLNKYGAANVRLFTTSIDDTAVRPTVIEDIAARPTV